MKTITINVPDDCEVKIVRKEEEKKEPVIRTYQDLIDSTHSIKGYYIGNVSEIIPISNLPFCEANKGIAAETKIAKSMLAMAMISQLMPHYGGEITKEEWKTGKIIKYVITRINNEIVSDFRLDSYYFLAFHTEQQRDEFLKYNEQLVKDYLMID